MKAEVTGRTRDGQNGSTRHEFAGRLAALHRAAGAPSLRNIAMQVQRRANEVGGQTPPALASAQRISDWLSGRNVPARFESLLPVLQVLNARATRRMGTAAEAIDMRAWRMLWTAARSAPADTTGTPAQSRTTPPNGVPPIVIPDCSIAAAGSRPRSSMPTPPPARGPPNFCGPRRAPNWAARQCRSIVRRPSGTDPGAHAPRTRPETCCPAGEEVSNSR